MKCTRFVSLNFTVWSLLYAEAIAEVSNSKYELFDVRYVKTELFYLGRIGLNFSCFWYERSSTDCQGLLFHPKITFISDITWRIPSGPLDRRRNKAIYATPCVQILSTEDTELQETKPKGRSKSVYYSPFYKLFPIVQCHATMFILFI